ncbi:hypothetical protein RDn1_104 [Candidatus Termititenax dinenymphae]|uniref:DUF306 domain-containing protein n=1 Tax=Candidatus Termititenax dinenymphae TaxID=2218523 RepID=A0A388TM71_9BACT|nr:hypothetical protein RDn1_104 [Candidatus Termititenax dinenymphae]
MKINKILISVLLILSCLFFVGCKKQSDPLADLFWHLTELNGNPVVAVAGREPNLTFQKEKSTVAGSGGVNRFSGQYTSGKNKALSFSPLAATQMAGLPQAMETEDGFFKALAQTQKYELPEAGRLNLLDAYGNIIAVLEAVTYQ